MHGSQRSLVVRGRHGSRPRSRTPGQGAARTGARLECHAAIWAAAHNEPLPATLDLLWDRAADLMRRHIELSLLSLGPAAVARAEDGVGPA